MDADEIWYLKKHDDHTVFGPVNLDNLRDWAMAAKISPLDQVSSDGQRTWERAPMIPALHMDWLVEVNEDFLYGPTTIGTVQEFLANGEIREETIVINCKENIRCAIEDDPVLKNAPRKTPASVASTEVPISERPRGIRGMMDIEKKILELESLVLQQKRKLQAWEHKYQTLREKYIKAIGAEP